MSIGLARGTVVLEPHNTEWKISANKIIDNLKNILKDDIMDTQHIGSTSILHIYAKSIVDIVVGVNDFGKIMEHNDALKKAIIIYCNTIKKYRLWYNRIYYYMKKRRLKA